MSQTVDDIEVTDNAAKNRYEARIGGELAGYADYLRSEDLVVFTHTVVKPQFEGRGVGSTLVRHALDDIRAEGTRSVEPQCSFVKAWIAKHPEYIPLVYGDATPAAD